MDTVATLLLLLLGLSATMSLGWAFQRKKNNGGWTDVFWTFGTGAACVAGALPPGEVTTRQLVVAAMAAVWSFRLGFHIQRRVAGANEEDRRYARFRKDWGAHFQRRMFVFLQSQALAGAVLAGAVHISAHNPAPFGGTLDYVGLLLFGIGLAGETAADAQLASFKADRSNRGRVADGGLWAWSCHPNYFFEWLIWVALALLAIAPAYAQGWLAPAAPVLMFVLLNYVSGVPPLERAMRQSRGAAFDAYAARTSRFFPLPPRAPKAT